MKHLLIVYHTQTGNTGKLAEAVRAGASDELLTDVEVRYLKAAEAGPDDLLWANGLLLGTPENFGYMSGAMKDFLDRNLLSGGRPDPAFALRYLHQCRQRWQRRHCAPYGGLPVVIRSMKCRCH